jgi:hypothetical protein
LGTEHHGRTLAALRVEGLRVGAAIHGAIVHLHLFAAADHHGVLGRPLTIFGLGVFCVLVGRSGDDGFTDDQDNCRRHRHHVGRYRRLRRSLEGKEQARHHS